MTARLACIAQRKRLAIAIAGLIPLIGRILLLGVLPIPKPAIQDEFSYLLAADTFAHGRLTNPTPAFPEHFETMQVLLHPSYASKYPPFSALVMAAGQKLGGNPWFGVWFSMGVLCAVLCWALQGWLPPPWAFAGSLIAALQIGLVSYWTESYWGGTCAAIGGALVVGAVPRLLERPRARTAIALAAGLAILANTRPYEGLLLALICLTWLAYAIRTVLIRIALPMLLVLLPVFLWMGYYNWRVTGNAREMPYTAHERQYGVPSPLLLQTTVPPTPAYSNEFLRHFWQVEFRGEWQAERNQFWKAHLSDLIQLGRFFLGWPLLLSMIFLARALWRDPVARKALLLAACFYAGAVFDARLFPHYAAPAAALAYILAACTLRALPRYFAWSVAGLSVLITGMTLLTPENRYLFGPIDYHVQAKHAAIESRLAAVPGPQLVLVRYGPRHDPWEELVYNRADLEQAKIVWARSLSPSEDERLLRHFRGRTIWLLVENGSWNLTRSYSSSLTQSIRK
ncbi:MAG TPA: hypothetical protein VMB25_11335 [Bryobacteraceae bacterium]|nr:hypothetical protein [Bryobacteraceae bacterium]